MTTKPPPVREVRVGDRVVGIYEYGDPAGAPVMVLHGTPACGAGFAFADEPARERGLRLIAPDRPGVGLSTPSDPYTVADYPAQLGALADALELDHFAVWGYSGGGPYAAATAATLAARVPVAAVSAGMGQVGVWARFDDFEKTDRQMLAMATKRPWLAKLMLGVTARLARMSPKSAMKSFEKQMNDSDRAIVPFLGAPDEVMALFTHAFLRGAGGVVADYAALAQPWGVAVEETTIPVAIFHGDADTMVPLRHSEELAARMPNARLTVWPSAGHLGTIANVGEILDAVRT
jgi:pimeloyl-ACP methyl ester carboxylesterase